MKTHKILNTSLFLVIWFSISCQLSIAQDKLVSILDEEIQREMQLLKQQETPAYYISYRVEEIRTYNINSYFGTISASNERYSSYLSVTVRVGTPEIDNFHQVRGSSGGFSNYSMIDLPSIDEPLAIKQVVWSATNNAYQQAVAKFSAVKANLAVKVEEEDKSPDFIMEPGKNYYEVPLGPEDFKYDVQNWEKRLNKYSAAFLKDSSIFSGSSSAAFQVTRKYFVSSNGDKIVQNNATAKVYLDGIIKARDGMEMPLYESYFALKPDSLPSDEVMTKNVNTLVNNLIALKTAPIAEPYSGPALLTGRAAGVFFHEIFGHRIEGQRMKNENDAQTFKKKVNEQVLPVALSVYCDPQLKDYAGKDINGYYIYDDQGSEGKRVDVVQKGILKDFLMSRTPITGFGNSNGHGRAQIGLQPEARQSNLIIETSLPRTNEQLRAELIKQVKEQNKPYGYLFDDVVGGFTMTGRFIPNAFNITPVLVYRVYTDGRPDEIVRGVDLIGTPLSMFSQIDQAGGEIGIFNGTCGADSGSVPVSSACPMLLIKMIETQKKAKSQERPIILPRPDSN